MKANILGIIYNIIFSNDSENQELKNADGYTDFYYKEIVLSDLKEWKDESNQDRDYTVYRKQIIRHEIIHAFLYESGLAFNSSESGHWSTNEEMIDWIAIQFPKILQVFKEVDCL